MRVDDNDDDGHDHVDNNFMNMVMMTSAKKSKESYVQCCCWVPFLLLKKHVEMTEDLKGATAQKR